ncbi:hypothetical protein TNCV_906811 [Trichonephila clavipes]|nr:hypothetical protein TNCV_906811 [Trichonephila clavipes]
MIAYTQTFGSKCMSSLKILRLAWWGCLESGVAAYVSSLALNPSSKLRGASPTLFRVRKYKERNEHLQSVLDEVETDQAREELDEIRDINHYSESEFQKSDEHETFELKGKFSNAI